MKLPEPFFFEGGEKAILLFHAYTGSSNDVRMLGRALQNAGYTVYAPHLTGHATGKVEDLVGSGIVNQWLKDGEKAYHDLIKKGYQKIVPMGLSLGGAIATHIALKQSVIASGSFCTPIVEDDVAYTNVPREFKKLVSYQFKMRHLTENRRYQMMEKIDQDLTQTLIEINVMNADIRNSLSSLKTPYYIAEAGQDEFINPDAGKKLSQLLTHVPVSYHHFESSGHVITVDKEHKKFEETVLHFLEQLDWMKSNE